MNIDRPKLHRIYRYVIDWLYPNVCPCCDRLIDHDKDFCDDCKSCITRYSGNVSIPGTDGFAAYCVYDDFIKHAILQFKEDPCGNSYYAFACGIYTALCEKAYTDDIDVIVPIPLSKKTMRKRGYNQTELIAKELRFLMDKPYVNALVKIKETRVQKNLGFHERAENVSGAYGINPKAESISGKRVLLIDDVCTTGNTLSEAAGTLRKGGAVKVYTASFAKTPYKNNASEQQIT